MKNRELVITARNLEERLAFLRENGVADLHLDPRGAKPEAPARFVRTLPLGEFTPPLSPLLMSRREKSLWLQAFCTGMNFKG